MDYLIKRILNSLEAGISKEKIQYYFDGKPEQLPEEILLKGVICVDVGLSDVEAVTTGVTDQETFDVNIIVAKIVKNEYYKEGQTETGKALIRKIVEGSDDNGLLLTNTVRHIIRSNMRTFGIMQPAYQASYDSQEFDNNGCVSATITISVVDMQQQQIT